MSVPAGAKTARDLPLPDADALGHSRRVAEMIRAEIAASGGSISFRRYMELALYAPGAGYYSAGTEKFGRGGDFVTAPEISPLFSACLARQCAEVLRGTGGVVLELGAGSGAMACDVLRALEASGDLPDAYLVLERSADLRARQERRLRDALPHLVDRVQWLDRLPEAPIRGVMLANEVADAMPVARGRVKAVTAEMAVAAEGEGFAWREVQAPADLAEHVRRVLGPVLAELPDGYTTEFNPDLWPWIASLADLLEAGVIFIIDYGYPRAEYYHPDRTDGTLICHFRHRAHWDPFLYPGLQDISASVDFTAVAEAGTDAGLEVLGFTTQAHFLLGLGLAGMAAL